MNLIKKVVIVFIMLGAISIIFLTWYSTEHSMEEAMPMEVNEITLQNHLLIATQGSKFKQAVVEKTIEQMKELPVYIKVIDVSQLASIDEKQWSAIIILHTWEYSASPAEVSVFIKKVTTNKLIILSTSERGGEKIDGVDAITAASRPDEIASSVEMIVERTRTILKI